MRIPEYGHGNSRGASKPHKVMRELENARTDRRSEREERSDGRELPQMSERVAQRGDRCRHRRYGAQMHQRCQDLEFRLLKSAQQKN